MKSINMQIHYYRTQDVFYFAKKCAILLRTSVLLEIDKDFYLSEKKPFFFFLPNNHCQFNSTQYKKTLFSLFSCNTICLRAQGCK